MKYIITREGEVLIGNVGHWELSQSVHEVEIISAGRCKLENGRIKVWGKSNSFNIPSRPEDAEILTNLLK